METTEKKEFVNWVPTQNLQKVVIEDDAGNILILKRSETGFGQRKGKDDFVGGSLEQSDFQFQTVNGQPHELALKREIREEIELEVEGEFIPIWTQSGSKETRTAGAVLIMAHGYKCRVGGVKPEIKLSDEHTGYRWLSPSEFSSIDFGEDENGFHVQVLKAYLASRR